MDTEISTIAVLGAGTMGRGIAHVAALAGYDDAPLRHQRRGRSRRPRRASTATSTRGSSSKKVDAGAAETAKQGLHSATTISRGGRRRPTWSSRRCPRTWRSRSRPSTRVALHAPEHALFASNTSALSITEMAAASGRPERFAGMHFFNPVHVMKLIELVRGLETSRGDARRRCARSASGWARRSWWSTRPRASSPRRINALIGNEAFRMLQEGVASAEDIDKALKLGLNHPMGPFEMVDLVGLDVRLSILEFLHRTPGRGLPAQPDPRPARPRRPARPQGGPRRLRLRRERPEDQEVASSAIPFSSRRASSGRAAASTEQWAMRR